MAHRRQHVGNPNPLEDNVVFPRDVQDAFGTVHVESIDLLFLSSMQCSSFIAIQKDSYTSFVTWIVMWSFSFLFFHTHFVNWDMVVAALMICLSPCQEWASQVSSLYVGYASPLEASVIWDFVFLKDVQDVLMCSVSLLLLYILFVKLDMKVPVFPILV